MPVTASTLRTYFSETRFELCTHFHTVAIEQGTLRAKADSDPARSTASSRASKGVMSSTIVEDMIFTLVNVNDQIQGEELLPWL